MTVSTELSHEEYTGNGVTTDFDFRFRIFEAKHLIVSVADQDGTERILTNGTDYTLRGVGSYRGGKVILKMPLATGWKIGIVRDLPAVQETDLRNQGKFFAEVHEDAFDYLTMLIQKSLGFLSLCLRKPSFISDHYDAKGNKISNLGKPVKDGDAVDLDTMNEHIRAKDKRSLRVADKDIPALPGTSVRRNKQLGFDNNGMPLLLDPAETGALGYVLVDSFEKGAVITSRYQALHWLHNGEYYRWDGDLPKTVPAGSAPDSAGGVGTGAWVGIGDSSLRKELNSDIGSTMIGHSGRRLNETIGSVANVSAYWREGDIDWGAAIQRAIDSGADTLEFTALPDGGKYNHSNTVIFNSDVKGSGIVNYTGNGDAYFATKKITVSGVRFESAGNDQSLWNITNATGITFCDNASVSGGRYNILVNGVVSQLTICGGVSIKYARIDNVKIIQCKRSVIEYDAYIYGAVEWGVNVDTTEAAEPDQMHGTVISGQIWGNKSGGVRCVGVDKLGDKGDWLQHLVIGGHIDHNYSDDEPERESHGIYIRYAVRPVIQADVIRGTNGYGLNIDHSLLPVISNKAYWKNKKGDYYIGENTGGAVILPYVGDYDGVNKNPTDTTEYGRSLSIWGNAKIGGGVLSFSDTGSMKQFLSGGGRGNLLVDINSPEDKERKFTVTNGSRTDTKLLVSGQIGCVVYDGSPGGAVRKKIAICDQAGVFVGYIPVYQ
ncbi:hypothetical protein [Morganella morganii]|uniref:tail fiber/spike domain-containing protein n=1 Tax=Morganella morganii TaxID=582 RepID=UPI003EBCAD39